MKLNKINMLCSKIELKKNSKGEAYLLIDLLELGSGDNFQIMSKEIELMSKLKPMMKYKLDLNITSNKYGIMMELSNILEELGSI